jgi:hypothetical protein
MKMKRIMKSLSVIAALSLSLVLWSCDSINQPTQPGPMSVGGSAVYNSSGKKYEVAREAASVGTVSATIGSSGGQLILGKHRLIVPRGAVSNATVFTMSRVDGDQVRFRFSATRNTHNDVGAAGFAVPVQLRIVYEDVTLLPSDLSILEVVYFRPDGTITGMATQLNFNQRWAEGSLPHFSDFGLAWPTRSLSW